MNTDRALIHTLRDRVIARKAVLFSRIQDDRTSGEDVVSLVIRYSAIEETQSVLSSNGMIDILNNDLFEIYIYNPEPVTYCGEKVAAGSITGWDIKWVLAPNEEAIKQYPFFDCIISKNDNSTGQAIDAELFLP